MHELSIAQSILDLLQPQLPPFAVLQSVNLRIGELTGVDADSLDFAWRAVLSAAGMPSAQLNIQIVPWHVRCGACGHQWRPNRADTTSLVCKCGAGPVLAIAGRELEVIDCHVEIPDNPDAAGVPAAAMTE